MTSMTATTAIRQTAERFFDACETGKGWEVCQSYCHPNATFSSQTAALAGIDTLQAYTEWMKGVYTPLPDARYELKAFGVDEERQAVLGFGVFRATHTGEGGPVPATGKQAEADYVYVMEFDGDRIRHMTKIWHSGLAVKELGWA